MARENLSDLIGFLAVAHVRSFTRAAAQLGEINRARPLGYREYRSGCSEKFDDVLGLLLIRKPLMLLVRPSHRAASPPRRSHPTSFDLHSLRNTLATRAELN